MIHLDVFHYMNNRGRLENPNISELTVNKGSFYAFSPYQRPIPAQTKLFCAVNSKEYPYNIVDFYLVYDALSATNDGNTYFITYTQPTPNTVPLYFHTLGNNVLPSFDPIPPSDLWTVSLPVFVIVNNKVKFQCVNGKCIPILTPINDMYVYDNNNTLFNTIEDCTMSCNETNNPLTDQTRIIYQLSSEEYTDGKNITCIIIVLIILTICLIFMK